MDSFLNCIQAKEFFNHSAAQVLLCDELIIDSSRPIVLRAVYICIMATVMILSFSLGYIEFLCSMLDICAEKPLVLEHDQPENWTGEMDNLQVFVPKGAQVFTSGQARDSDSLVNLPVEVRAGHEVVKNIDKFRLRISSKATANELEKRFTGQGHYGSTKTSGGNVFTSEPFLVASKDQREEDTASNSQLADMRDISMEIGKASAATTSSSEIKLPPNSKIYSKKYTGSDESVKTIESISRKK
ncbi:hypothetical protein HDE_13567 [Halotydeus destructor]|nr:hypothetical protein HDE_13567 [Halotydeus destructor]